MACHLLVARLVARRVYAPTPELLAAIGTCFLAMPFSLTGAIPAFASPVVAHAFIAVIALAALSSLVSLFLLAPLTYQRLG